MDRALNKLLKYIPQSQGPPKPSGSNASTSSISKRGLAWPATNIDQPFYFTRPGTRITWLYNWSPHPPPGPIQSSLTFVPMQWNHVSSTSFNSAVQSAQAPAVLAFNEPELSGQANMAVQHAADVWMADIEPLRRTGVRCGSPGISSAPEGIIWLKHFLHVIRNCGGDVDFYCFHWYGETLEQFYNYIWSTHHQLDADKPVWITEFACTNWSLTTPLGREYVENFLKESCGYLDTLHWVERYAWFGAMSKVGNIGRWAAMLDGEGKLTHMGKTYRDC